MWRRLMLRCATWFFRRAGVGFTKPPVMHFEDWRHRRWGGPCHSPATEEEYLEYRVYLAQHAGIADMETYG